jgi:16S rRNA (guanine527-N7)-methyltransferase
VNARTLEKALADRVGEPGLTIGPIELQHLQDYWSLLARWNHKVNLTSLPLQNYPAPSVDRLIVEPLEAARFVQRSSFVWFDLGSGGGSPAIPLKIVRPLGRLTMVESRSKKAAFLREVVRVLRMTEATVIQERADTVSKEGVQCSADLVTVRAVRLERSLQQAIGDLLKVGGRAFLFASEGGSVPQLKRLSFVSSHELPRTRSVLHVYSRLD